MPTFDAPQLLDALSTPVGDMISSIGKSVAVAQQQMDAASLSAWQQIYSENTDLFRELQRIGYRPTWYHIPEVEADLSLALTVSGTYAEGQGSGATSLQVFAAPVDAGYSSRFNYSLQAASRVRFKIVPVPPSTSADQLRVVPALVGLSLGEARARLSSLQVSFVDPTAEDTAQVTAQSPAAGTILASGESVTLTVTP